jgi:hypothetical protein
MIGRSPSFLVRSEGTLRPHFPRAIGKRSLVRQAWPMAAPVCLYAVSIALFYGFIADDSFITARYAENLVDWGQLVFNPGERISALTSPLHANIHGWDLLAHRDSSHGCVPVTHGLDGTSRPAGRRLSSVHPAEAEGYVPAP